MKIAIIENYSIKCSYQGRHRDSGEWNDLYLVEHSYIYTFYSDSKEIPIEKYKVIDTYLKQFNKSSNETREYYTKEDTHQMFDIEKSNFLAKVLNCQTFEPGILPLNIFQHKIHQKNIYIKDNDNLYKEEIIADVSAISTLPVLKYLKLIKEDKYWKGINSHSNIYIDENNNLCCVGRYNVFKISIVLADFIYIPYKTHDKSPFGDIELSPHAIIIKDDLYGVINLCGEIIIKYQKYKINEIYNNFCIVEHNKCYSCMNFDGKILMPFTIQNFSIYYDRYIEITYDNFKFLYDLQYSKFILNANYKDLILIDKKLIFVKDFNGFVDIYNHDSLKINNDFLENVRFCDNSIIICKIKLGWIIYDYNGNVIFLDRENKYTSIDVTDDDIKNIRLKQKKANNYFIYGLADIKGNIIIPCYSDSPIKVFQYKDEFYYILRKYKKEYLCNQKGQILSSKYDLIKKGQEGICIAYNGQYTIESDKLNFIDGIFYAITLDGKVIFSLKSQNLFSFKHGLATIKQNNKYGKVNLNGEIVIPPIYDKLNALSNGLIAAYIKDKWGYIDKYNNTVIDFKYDQAYDVDDDGEAYVELNGYSSKINIKGEYIEEMERILRDDYSYYNRTDDDTYIRDGLAEAFNDDPSNYWNID